MSDNNHFFHNNIGVRPYSTAYSSLFSLDGACTLSLLIKTEGLVTPLATISLSIQIIALIEKNRLTT